MEMCAQKEDNKSQWERDKERKEKKSEIVT
jgi:hypothetical protein